MDTSGFSQVGRYGTISLMKRNEEHAVVTSFGIDTEELTFGRETTCGVRLYYPDVALLHCKVVFEERKAFLVVLGESGVLVDGCKVFPHTSNNLSTIIPLANHSEFEIHGKRFRFSYPPKAIRATLFATPARPRKSALRLSMIHSAQVFSPQPSKDPRENLRILQSPLKNSFKSPVRSALLEEDQIILVQGSHPRVVQEERDLVILEDVVLVPSPPSKPQANSELPRTPPRRKSLGGNTLHRAVLIRSAQRAVLKAEKEREDEEEEMEVLGAIVGADDEGEYEDNEREDIEMGSPSAEGEGDEAQHPERDSPKPMWRKSLEKMMRPFGGSEENTNEAGRTAGDSEDDEDGEVPSTLSSMDLYSADSRTDDFEDEDETEASAPLPSQSNLQYTPIRRTLGSFMTPQAKFRHPSNVNRATDALPPVGRFSLGGGEARRVVVQQPWRVRDLVIPPPATTSSSSVPSPVNSSDQASNRLHSVMVSPERTRTSVKLTLTEEERKSIQERRRSALKETGPFFPGGAPGLSPMKPKSASSSLSPVGKRSLGIYNSPLQGRVIHEESGEVQDREDKEEEEDTRSLLDRMKETVDGMRRRRSIALTTPQAERLGLPRSLFATITTPQRPISQPELHEVGNSMEDETQPFSLLRPGVRDEVVSRLTLPMLEIESSVEGPIPLPVAIVDPVGGEGSWEIQDSSEAQEQPTRRREGRSRLLRAPKSIDVAAGLSEPNIEEEQKESNCKPRSKSTGPAMQRSRSGTPQPSVPEEESDEVARTLESSTTIIGESVAAATRRRTRKATVEPEEQPVPATGKRGRKTPVNLALESSEQDIEKLTPKAKGLPVKRGRKADLSVEDEEQHAYSSSGDQRAEGFLEVTTTPAAAPIKRGRPRKAVAQKILDQENSTSPVPVIAKAVTKKTTTPSSSNSSRIRETRTKLVVKMGDDDDEEEEEDPLDSYNAAEGDDAGDADMPGSSSRTNQMKTKSRKTATSMVAVKQEQDDDRSFSDLEEEALLATAKSTGPRTGGTKNAGRGTPAARTSATKSRGRKTRTKTPATAPASATLIGSDKDKDKEKDKENTPGSTGLDGADGSGKLSPSISGDGEDSQMQAQEVAVKVRVSRKSRGAAAAAAGRAGGTTGNFKTGSTRSASKAVKVEEAEAAVVEPVRVRSTRARTRTKTG